MASTPEKLKIAREKAYKSPLIGKHGKAKKTIEKEKRRAIFDEIVSKEFKNLVKQARPEYKIDQFMGKTPEIVTIDLTLKEVLDKINKIFEEDEEN